MLEPRTTNKIPKLSSYALLNKQQISWVPPTDSNSNSVAFIIQISNLKPDSSNGIQQAHQSQSSTSQGVDYPTETALKTNSICDHLLN